MNSACTFHKTIGYGSYLEKCLKNFAETEIYRILLKRENCHRSMHVVEQVWTWPVPEEFQNRLIEVRFRYLTVTLSISYSIMCGNGTKSGLQWHYIC